MQSGIYGTSGPFPLLHGVEVNILDTIRQSARLDALSASNPQQVAHGRTEDRRLLLGLVGGDVNRCREAELSEQRHNNFCKINRPVVERDSNRSLGKRSGAETHYGFLQR